MQKNSYVWNDFNQYTLIFGGGVALFLASFFLIDTPWIQQVIYASLYILTGIAWFYSCYKKNAQERQITDAFAEFEHDEYHAREHISAYFKNKGQAGQAALSSFDSTMNGKNRAHLALDCVTSSVMIADKD